eukprot:symbB.v1.2.027105.t1/scaffold2758.1/size77635/4
MVALEAVCKHFGKEVHPESEWIYMQKDRDFFMHMQLSSGFSEPFPKAGVPEHGAKNLGFITSSASANARFVHHQPLLWKKLRMDEPTEVVAPPKPPKAPTSKALVAPPGSPESPEPVKLEAENLEPTPKADSPRNVTATPEEQLRRRPHVVLSSNSRVFQNCSTEVTMNERRAVKEAKSKVLQGGVVREPLVTPRDQGQSRSIAKRHWQKGFALASQSLQQGSAGAAATGASSATPTPKAVPSSPEQKRASSSEESFALAAMQLVRPRGFHQTSQETADQSTKLRQKRYGRDQLKHRWMHIDDLPSSSECTPEVGQSFWAQHAEVLLGAEADAFTTDSEDESDDKDSPQFCLAVRPAAFAATLGPDIPDVKEKRLA